MAPLELLRGFGAFVGSVLRSLSPEVAAGALLACLALAAAVEGEAEANASEAVGGNNSLVLGPDKDKQAATRIALCALCCLFVLCGGGILWCFHLENRPEARQTRIVMSCVLVFVVILDFTLCLFGCFFWWMFPASALMNVWGPLDALLRYPIIHGFDELFAWKQILLMLAKVLTYCYSLKSFAQYHLVGCLAFMLNVVALPLMYLLALPFDELGSNSQSGHRVVDTDIAVRFWNIASHPRERKEFLLQCRARARVLAAAVARRLPALEQVMTRYDPELKRHLRKSGRNV